ncbi:MAG: cation:proton antiporter [Ruminococcus sp.]|nr:cation:proton antiporter [Ruminococcus sp.]
MTHFLLYFVVILSLICLLGFFNEKVTKLTYEISLMMFAIVIGAVILIAATVFSGTTVGEVLADFQVLNIEKYLMDGVLCFMLFAGSCHLKLSDFVHNARQVSVLSFIATFLGACFYGLLFYGAGLLLGLNLSLPICLMFGSIVAPTDPIAATSILNKFGLPQKISFLIEGESLFNDGVGVALFACFSGLATSTSSSGFFSVMLPQIFGAAGVGAAVTLICFPLYRFTKSNTLGIFVSLLSVAAAYYLCELFGFSGAIASVVSGILFAALRSSFCTNEDSEKAERFSSFWDTLDTLMNSVLYILLGLSFVRILQMEHVIVIALVAIVANMIARAGSLSLSTLLMGKLPDGYNKLNFVKLLTWGGLRGGLSVALAMSTREMLPENIYFIILGGTYAIVFFTTVIQGLTMKPVYNRISKSVSRRTNLKK